MLFPETVLSITYLCLKPPRVIVLVGPAGMATGMSDAHSMVGNRMQVISALVLSYIRPLICLLWNRFDRVLECKAFVLTPSWWSV